MSADADDKAAMSVRVFGSIHFDTSMVVPASLAARAGTDDGWDAIVAWAENRVRGGYVDLADLIDEDRIDIEDVTDD